MTERNDERRDAPTQGRLTILCGAHPGEEYDTMHGRSIGEVEIMLRDVLSIPENSTPILDGQEVTRDTRIGDNAERLEFTRRVGTKA